MNFVVLMIIVGFLSGAVMYSYCLPKWILKKDVRENTTDNNPGGYNAYSVHKGLGLLCIFLDMLKGFIPVFIFVKVKGIETPWITLMVLAPVLGHAFSPFLRGKGGKALSTTVGSLLGVLPKSGIGVLLVGLAMFFSFIVIIEPFASRVVGVLLVFDILICLLQLANIWLIISALCITAILWYKQIKVRDPRPATVSWVFSKKMDDTYQQ